MQPRTENARARRIFIPLFVAVALLSTVVRAAPAAAVDCQAAALSALGVADMTIDSATDVPAAAPNPESTNLLAARSRTFSTNDSALMASTFFPSAENQSEPPFVKKYALAPS